MRIRKMVSSATTNEQGPGDTNVQVVALFEAKPDLGSVTLTFENGSTKLYERV